MSDDIPSGEVEKAGDDFLHWDKVYHVEGVEIQGHFR